MVHRERKIALLPRLLMTHALVAFLSSSRRASVQLVARALTTTTTNTATNSFLSTRRSSVVAQQPLHNTNDFANAVVRLPRHHHQQQRQSRCFVAGASVDEDLDAALDEILGNAFAEAEAGSKEESSSFLDAAEKNHMEGSKPMPQTLMKEDDPEDFKDPEFLSTSNPRWVQAGLSQSVIDILSSKGITHFTPVQGEAFDPIVARRDVIGRSRTGTGKTLAFGLPSMTRMVEYTRDSGKRESNGRMAKGRKPSMIILCPTRELARQVQDELKQVGRPLGLFVEVFHGGVSYDPQARALRNGLDIVVGTPGRVIDHLGRGNLDLSEIETVVLDEADEMLNMGFADDVEHILEGVGSALEEKTQCLLFSATTPPWVKEIGRNYQKDVLHIDSTTEEGGARVAKTVRHCAVQLPPGVSTKQSMLEDIIAVEISKDAEDDDEDVNGSDESNPIAAAAAKKKKSSNNAMQQKVFGKTIVFTETKRQADELVSGGVFKSLSAQALHGDVGQKQRDATLNAFRAGAFNVLVATDVAARGIDIQDVDLVVQMDPPRDTDTYVHRSGRTGRAGQKGVSVLMFNRPQARDIVRIERSLGHGFKFDLVGPPTIEAALKAAARTSAIASKAIPDETAQHFKQSAAKLLAEGEDPEDVIARCLAAISRRSTEVISRSLITGESGMTTVEMTNKKGRSVNPNDVMFTVGKLSRMSNQDGELSFDSDVGRIQMNREKGSAMFDMGVEDAKNLIEFSKDIEAGGAVFQLVKQLEVDRDRNFGRPPNDRRGGGGGRYNNSRGGGLYKGRGGRQGGGGYRNSNNYHGGQNRRSKYDRDGGGRSRYGGEGGNRGNRYSGGGRSRYGAGGEGRGRYDNRRNNNNNDDW